MCNAFVKGSFCYKVDLSPTSEKPLNNFHLLTGPKQKLLFLHPLKQRSRVPFSHIGHQTKHCASRFPLRLRHINVQAASQQAIPNFSSFCSSKCSCRCCHWNCYWHSHWSSCTSCRCCHWNCHWHSHRSPCTIGRCCHWNSHWHTHWSSCTGSCHWDRYTWRRTCWSTCTSTNHRRPGCSDGSHSSQSGHDSRREEGKQGCQG